MGIRNWWLMYWDRDGCGDDGAGLGVSWAKMGLLWKKSTYIV